MLARAPLCHDEIAVSFRLRLLKRGKTVSRFIAHPFLVQQQRLLLSPGRTASAIESQAFAKSACNCFLQASGVVWIARPRN